jgi:prepilin-type N-terminal cleavage/methylation domain-containing protein
MRHTLKQRKQDGFTIIEVLIVLAIAGLILLVVFLAVPALQRNSRNTTAKSEAAGLLGAASEFTNNNNGKLPTAGGSGTAGSDAAKIFALTKTQNITTLTIEAQGGTTAPTSTTAVMRLAAKCTSATGSTVTPAGAGRQLALLYMIEDSSGALVACQES